jgi:hypothetical protein
MVLFRMRQFFEAYTKDEKGNSTKITLCP